VDLNLNSSFTFIRPPDVGTSHQALRMLLFYIIVPLQVRTARRRSGCRSERERERELNSPL